MQDRGYNLSLVPRQADNDSGARLREQDLLAPPSSPPLPEHTGDHQLPWPIDILAYPTNVHGLISLGIIVGIPFLLGLLCRLVPLLLVLLGLPLFIVRIVMCLYAGWYFAECVYDSAKGGTHAPEVSMGVVGIGDMWSRVIHLAIVYILFASPAGVYYLVTQKTDVSFWGLVISAVAFFPIGLLAMAIIDSMGALNPFFLLGSVSRVFFQYTGFVIVLGLLTTFVLLVAVFVSGCVPVWLSGVEDFFIFYSALVIAHVLGRFYWRNSERLDWEA